MMRLGRRWLVMLTVVMLLIATVGIGATPGLAADSPSTRLRGINLDATTIPRLQQLMDSHRLTSADLVRFYQRRIDRLNGRLHAVIAVSKTALADARRADRARRDGTRLPLLGIPVIVKDNIGTTGMATTAGSLALKNSRPPDAFIVARLRAAGAIVLGKANLSEWANFRSLQSSSGWSAVGGQTNLPYALDRNPCGSSSGSGVVPAANLATIAIGTETDGSIVCPAGANGLVGIKPSLGLASRSGIVPLSAQQDTPGPMARNVTDAAVLLGVMTGVDPTDPATATSTGHVFTDYTQFLDKNALKGARIGVWRQGNFGVSPETDAIMEATIARLQELGATIVDPADIPIEPAYEPEFTALLYEFKHDIAAYLATLPANQPKTLQDLIDFNNAHAAQELKWFGQEIFDLAQATGTLTDPAYIKARADATSIAQKAIDDTLAANDLDVIIAPTNSPAWTTDLVNGDHFSIGSSSPAAIAGYASITVTAGAAFGLPVGVSFIGGKWAEPKLISLAYAWEQATKLRKPPSFLPTVPASATSGIPTVKPAGGAVRRLEQMTKASTRERSIIHPAR
jgi:amidase